MAFDVETVRAEFPILTRHVHGKPLVYLDSAASAQKPRAVIEAMARAMEHSYANVHRGLHTLANETTDAYEGARQKAAAFIGSDPNEIVFTKGGTEAVNLVAAGLAERLQAGDEIVLSEMEHHANIVPWHFLRERKGVVLKWVAVTDEGVLDLEAFQHALGPKTKVVALSHMSNVLGTINPAKDLARMAHEAGALVLFDGCQAIVHKSVDVKDIDADFYVFSGHKLYGPTGIGVLYGKAELLASLPPYQGGGEMIGTVTLDEITYADPPHRFEAGTPPILEAIGLGAAIDWLSGFDRIAIAEHEHALYARVREGLQGMNWLRLIGEAPGKGAILSFTVDGAHAHDVAQILDRYGVAVRAGTHCAEPLMRRFGVTSSARASFALYNTADEADAFVDALTKTQAFFA
jgi:cysteine desulfurase / selenocysteine lyase